MVTPVITTPFVTRIVPDARLDVNDAASFFGTTRTSGEVLSSLSFLRSFLGLTFGIDEVANEAQNAALLNDFITQNQPLNSADLLKDLITLSALSDISAGSLFSNFTLEQAIQLYTLRNDQASAISEQGRVISLFV